MKKNKRLLGPAPAAYVTSMAAGTTGDLLDVASGGSPADAGIKRPTPPDHPGPSLGTFFKTIGNEPAGTAQAPRGDTGGTRDEPPKTSSAKECGIDSTIKGGICKSMIRI